MRARQAQRGATLRGNTRSLMVGAHILLGVAILEQMVALLQQTASEDLARTNNFATLAGALFALAMLLGLTAGVMRGRKPQATAIVLATRPPTFTRAEGPHSTPLGLIRTTWPTAVMVP